MYVGDEIQKAFLEGIEEVYTELLCTDLYIQFLDTERTVVDDVYGETTEKVYQEPIKLIGKINEMQPKADDPDQTVNRSVTIKLPTKQFLDMGISIDFEADWEMFRKAKLIHNNEEYLIDTVEPVTLIRDMWQFLSIRATQDKKTYVPPTSPVVPEKTEETEETQEQGDENGSDIY